MKLMMPMQENKGDNSDDDCVELLPPKSKNLPKKRKNDNNFNNFKAPRKKPVYLCKVCGDERVKGICSKHICDMCKTNRQGGEVKYWRKGWVAATVSEKQVCVCASCSKNIVENPNGYQFINGQIISKNKPDVQIEEKNEDSGDETEDCLQPAPNLPFEEVREGDAQEGEVQECCDVCKTHVTDILKCQEGHKCCNNCYKVSLKNKGVRMHFNFCNGLDKSMKHCHQVMGSEEVITNLVGVKEYMKFLPLQLSAFDKQQNVRRCEFVKKQNHDHSKFIELLSAQQDDFDKKQRAQHSKFVKKQRVSLKCANRK